MNAEILIKTGKILWTKSDIAKILGVNIQMLNHYFKIKPAENLEFKKGSQLFNDNETIMVIKHVRQTLTEEQIKEMLFQTAV